LKCPQCNDEETDHNRCTQIIEETHKRIENQRVKFSEVTGKLICRGCGKSRAPNKSYCLPCKAKANKLTQKKCNARRLTGRICKGEGCNVRIKNPNSNSQKFCSTTCKPDRIYIKESKEEKALKEKLQRVATTIDRHAGTIDIKWLRRFNPDNTVMNLCKDSDTGGAFTL
jgi:hypothetical protein